MSQEVVEEWIKEALPDVTVEIAWQRAGIERTVYARRAQDALRLGHADAAKEWALKAAECERAENTLFMVAKHYDKVKELVQELEFEERRSLHEIEQRRIANEARRKKFGEAKRRKEAGLT